MTPGALARAGRPRLMLRTGRSPGDALLATAVFRELRRRGGRGLWMQSDHADLFAGNPDVDAVVPHTKTWSRLTRLLGGRIVFPDYAPYDPAADRSAPPDRHIIALMCRLLGLSGDVDLRPYLHLTARERAAARALGPATGRRQVAIQSSGLAARLPMLNKEWGAASFQKAVDALRGELDFVQVGAPADPVLRGAVDARGRGRRDTAAILAASDCFVGLVGFLMHLARAVDTRAVIVYGGREAPWQTGYAGNENLTTGVPCSPCWLWNRCEHDRECLTAIAPGVLVDAIRLQVARTAEPLPVSRVPL